MSGTDAFEHLLAGASAVQIGTALVEEGPKVFDRIADELQAVLKKKGYPSATAAVGRLESARRGRKAVAGNPGDIRIARGIDCNSLALVTPVSAQSGRVNQSYPSGEILVTKASKARPPWGCWMGFFVGKLADVVMPVT